MAGRGHSVVEIRPTTTPRKASKSPPPRSDATTLVGDTESAAGLLDRVKEVDVGKYIPRSVIGRVLFPFADPSKWVGITDELKNKAKRHSNLLALIHLVVAGLFLANGLAALFCGIFWIKDNRPLQIVTEQYNSAAKIWYPSLDKAGNFKDPYLLAACSFLFAVYHLSHLFPLRDFYDGMILEWSKTYNIEIGYNAFRWLAKGVIGGGFMFVAQHMLGSLDVTSLSFGWLVFAAYCMAMLFMEMFNPVVAIRYGSPPETAIATAWAPLFCAVIAMLAWVVVSTVFFGISLADAGIKNYPIYLIVLYIFVVVLCVIEGVMHGLRHGQRILQEYVWVEYPSIALDTLLFIGITLIVILGVGISNK